MELNKVGIALINIGSQDKISYNAFPGQDGNRKVGRIALKAVDGLGGNYTIEIIPDFIPNHCIGGVELLFSIPINPPTRNEWHPECVFGSHGLREKQPQFAKRSEQFQPPQRLPLEEG